MRTRCYVTLYVHCLSCYLMCCVVRTLYYIYELTCYMNHILSTVSSLCGGMKCVPHQVHVCTLCQHVHVYIVYCLHFMYILTTGCFSVLLLLALIT